MNINKLKVSATVFSVLVLGSVNSGMVLAQNGNSNAGNKVTICHATGSATNPYVVITPNANGVINGHSGSGHQGGRDIIPPFSYNDHGTTKQYPGQNWDATGQAIYNNGCKVPAGGRGGGTQTLNSGGGGSTLGTSTGGRGAGSTGVVAGQSQVQVPAGAVAAGNGYSTTELNAASLVGLLSSLALTGFGLRRFARS